MKPGIRVGLVVLALWPAACHKAEPPDKPEEAAREHPAATEKETADGTESEPGTVTLDAAKAGIAAEPLAVVERPEERVVLGTVLDVQELADLATNLTLTAAERDKARADLEAARKAQVRLEKLRDDEQNASVREVEEAGARSAGAQALERQAEARRTALVAAASRQWGGEIAGWLTRGAAPLQRLLERQDLLILATLAPGDDAASVPASARVLGGGDKPIAAHIVSPAPRSDPRLLGLGFYLTTPSRGTSLQPGQSVQVRLASGRTAKVRLVPGSAVVWWQGRPWVYIEAAPSRFERHPLEGPSPEADGYAVPETSLPAEPVVVRGAATLLSQEFRSQIQGEE